jgi:cytochrome P450
VHAEIDAATGGGPPSATAATGLGYTRRVLNEVLRLHSVLLFTRRATEETELGGVRIPAGTEIAYSPYALHRDPAVYPDPARFDPDRWLPDRMAQLPLHTFSPFGAGQHKCIGDAFAWAEMTIVLAAIAQRWRLRPAPGHVVRAVPAEVPRPNALPMIAMARPA